MESLNRSLRFVLTLSLFIYSAAVFASPLEVQVIDGDTLSIDGVHYRLFGIDAPEAGQLCDALSGKRWRCGDAATKYLDELVRGKPISCDSRGIDDYDRTLAVCKAGDIEINATMITSGNAWAFTKYSDRYISLQNKIQETRIGIWQTNNEAPWDFRAKRWEVAAQVAPEGCPIKGNISGNGRIYHTPWSPWYSRTKVSVERGERWFCSEREALDAGWRAPIWGN